MLATREVRIARLAAMYAVEAMAERGGRVDAADVCHIADRARDAVDEDDKLHVAEVRADDPTVVILFPVSCKFCGVAHEQGRDGCSGYPNHDAGAMSTTDGLLPGRGDAA